MKMGKRMKAQRTFSKMRKKIKEYDDPAAIDKVIGFVGIVASILVLLIMGREG